MDRTNGMLTVKHPFAAGVWHITHDDDDVFYISFEKPPYAAQLMFVCKGSGIFSALAECATVMYGELHPEVKWDGPLQEVVKNALSK